MGFDSFAAEAAPRLRAGLVAAYGTQEGLEAAAEALAYGWEHWDRLSTMTNPSGYLYRVGQTAARNSRSRPILVPAPPPASLPDIEPGLRPALGQLSENQRTAVLMIHSFGWTLRETAELLDVDVSTVRTHLSRGMNRLRAQIDPQPPSANTSTTGTNHE